MSTFLPGVSPARSRTPSHGKPDRSALSPESADINSDKLHISAESRRSPTPSKIDEDRPPSGFGKARGVRTVKTPTTAQIQLEKRYWPRDMRGVLEVHEQGCQIQESMKAHCKDTVDAFEGLSSACEGIVRQMQIQIEEIFTRIEGEFAKPANIVWTPVLDALHRLDDIKPEAIQGAIAQKLMQLEENIDKVESRIVERFAESMKGFEKSQKEVEESQRSDLLQLRDELSTAQLKTSDLQNVVKCSEDNIARAMEYQRKDIKAELVLAMSNMEDTIKAQEKSRQEGLVCMEAVLGGITPVLTAGIMQALGEELKEMKSSIWQNMENVAKSQEEKIADVSIQFKEQLGRQFLLSMQAEEVPRQQIKELHKTLTDDVAHLFNEIGVIQRAMNLDFICKPRRIHNVREGLRSRDFMTQTDDPGHRNGCVQTEERYFQKPKKKKKEEALAQVAEQVGNPAQRKKSGFREHEKKKQKMREALIKPVYNVANYYHQDGYAQAIARSAIFENFTFMMIIANAVWIAIDTDFNDAAMLINADIQFQIVENIFCFYFSLELIIRFAAFRKKARAFRDSWFLFDSILVLGMVGETWIVSAVMLASGDRGDRTTGLGNLTILRMAKMVKLLRMARMARLLRMMPELVVILRSIGAAFRSVSFFFILTFLIIYVFAVAFRQMTKDTRIGGQYFSTVPRAMNSLLVDGMLPIYARIIDDVSDASWWYWLLIMMFILLASVTVMNMLIGVLVEVVRAVAEREKESMTVIHVTNELREVMYQFMAENQASGEGAAIRKPTSPTYFKSNSAKLDAVSEMPNIQKADFEVFLTRPQVMTLLGDCGVDALALMDCTDMIYEEKDKGGYGLKFTDFVEVVLNMRGSNPATVKDIKEQMRLLKVTTRDYAASTTKSISDEVAKLRMDVVNLGVCLKNSLDDDSDSGTSTMSPRLPSFPKLSSFPKFKRRSSPREVDTVKNEEEEEDVAEHSTEKDSPMAINSLLS